MLYNRTFWVLALSPKGMRQQRHTMARPYKYIVYHAGCNHSAFETLKGLRYWLAMTGLQIDSIAHHGKNENFIIALKGEYETKTIFNEPIRKFGTVSTHHKDNPLKVEWRWLCNAVWCKAIVNKQTNGNQIILQNDYENRSYEPYASDERLKEYIYYDGMLK